MAFTKNFMNFNSEISVEYSGKIEKLDRLIFGFIILFVATINNSIFFSQIGFFGAYILVGIRYYFSKENPFWKTDLDKAFLSYYFIVFVAAIFSVEAGNAFMELIKSIILLPIIYLLIFVANTDEKAKTILKFYLGASLATLLVYLIFSLKHYFTQLYQLELKGPSPFQYVMTAGGLMSFTAIFFFAFLINEKVKWKMKLFYLFAFGLSFFAVIASYTRAAWLGLFAGMFIILVLKKKWWVIIPTIVLIIVYLFSTKNESKVEVLSLITNKFEKTINTNGRAYSVMQLGGDTLLVAEYEKGISLYSGRTLIQNIKTEAPITKIKKWNEKHYLVYSLDSKFYILKADKNNQIKIVNSFITPGTIRDFTISNGKLYVAEKDSGLTIYIDPVKPENRLRFSQTGGILNVAASDKYVCQYSLNNSNIKIFSAINGSPNKIIDSIPSNSSTKFLWVTNNTLFYQNDKAFLQYSINSQKVKQIDSVLVTGIFQMRFDDKAAFALSIHGKILKGILDSDSVYRFSEIFNLNKTCSDFDIGTNTISISSFKRNRVSSMFDPNHETNYERINIWMVGFSIFKDYPIIGVGDIDLGNLYRKYKPIHFKENFGHLHNNLMQWIVTLGFIGFCVIIFLMVKILLLHYKIYRELKNEPIASSFALGAIASFIGFLASGMGEYNFGDQEIFTLVLFTIGLNLAFYYNYKRKTN